MSSWIDNNGHPRYLTNSDHLPRVGETLALGSDTFVGEEGEPATHFLQRYCPDARELISLHFLLREMGLFYFDQTRLQHYNFIELDIMHMNFGRKAIDAGLNIGKGLAPMVALDIVKQYNALILQGDIERARSQIKVEFQKNRQVAKLFYEKHKTQMDPEVKLIFKELIGENYGK
jgi:hypothetical protein